MKSHVAYVGIGSNLGNRLKNCEEAVREIKKHPKITVSKESRWIETEPFGYKDQNKFINGVIELKTSLPPHSLFEVLLSVEKKMGRTRTIKWGPRIIDLDLLLYDSLHIKDAELTIPHPGIYERDFVKIPLREIAPNIL